MPVKEPPITLTPTGIDVQPRKTGRPSLDLVIATCAIFVSVLSLLIAFNQSRMMRQQVAATSWPLLQFASGNTDDRTAASVISLAVENDGVGPAIVKRFVMKYQGKDYTNIYALLAECCGYRITDFDPTRLKPGMPLSSPVEGTIIRPGESIEFFRIALAPGNRATWLKLDRARFKLAFDACYCSVLGECWSSDLASVDPEPVRECAPAVRKDD
jgi:hypothetical protein